MTQMNPTRSSRQISMMIAAITCAIGLALLSGTTLRSQPEMEWSHQTTLTSSDEFLLHNDLNTSIELTYVLQPRDTSTMLRQVDHLGEGETENHRIPPGVVVRLSGRVVLFKSGGLNSPAELKWRYVD